MATYLPRTLPDELLYSLLARTAMHRGAASASGFTAELFGRRQAVSSFDLQGGIAALAASLGGGVNLDVDDVIDRLTLFPFYTAYASSTRRSEARNGMAGDMTGVHTRLGVTTYRIPSLRALRFCLACTAEWDDAGTEWYWRRSHQLPGVPICADHGCILRVSDVSFDGRGRHRFVAAARHTCHPDAPAAIPEVSPTAMNRFASLARSARAILEAPPPPAEPSEHVERYRSRLGDVGLMRSARKVDQAVLQERFMAFWGDALSVLPRMVTDMAPTGGWLMAMVRSPRRSAHPVCHLLLSLFLDAMEAVDTPFGAGPWLCVSPIAPHFGAAVIETVGVRRQGTTRYGDFRCGCGYHYTRSISLAGEIGPPRYRSFGPSLKPALIEMAAASISLRSAAKRVGLDPKTLLREATRLEVATPWSQRQPEPTKPKREPVKPHQGRATKVEGPPATEDRSPHSRRGRDWGLTDDELRRAAEKTTSEIRQLRPVVRVTWAEVERRIAAKGWIAKRRRKLPQTTRAIREGEEDLLDFRTRRLDAVLRRPDGNPGRSASDVLREAGLPMGWLPRIRAEMLASTGSG